MLSNKTAIQRLAEHECRDATHMTADSPRVWARAKGSLLWDCDGREYIDLCAGFGALPLGHNSEELKSACAIGDRISTGMGDLYATADKVALLCTLHEFMPDYLTHTALALSGSQAVELAIKTALLYHGNRHGFIVLQDSYHGLDFGALALTAMTKFRQPFSAWLPEHKVAHVPLDCPLSQLEQAVHQQRHIGTAAFILEPVQGRGGMRACADSWLRQVRNFCSDHGILLIFDEIFTGLGRSGTMTKTFTHECDLLCLGKALGGGMPISALLGREEVMQAWPRNTGEALHTGTFFGQPLSCRVAEATLNTIVSAKLCERAQQLGKLARAQLQKLLATHPDVVTIRGTGLMLAIVFRHAQQGVHVAQRLAARGVIAIAAGSKGECLSITPALNIAEGMLRDALQEIAMF